MKIEAIGTKILAVPIKEETEKVKFGSFEIEEDNTNWSGAIPAEVVSVGQEVPSLVPGDTILLYPGSGHEFKSRETGMDYIVVSVSEILGYIKK